MMILQTGDSIRQWREARGLTQSDLAALIGVSLRTVMAYEKAEQAPQVVALAIFALSGVFPTMPNPQGLKTGPRRAAPDGWERGWGVYRADPFRFLRLFNEPADAFAFAITKGQGHHAAQGDYNRSTKEFQMPPHDAAT